MLDVTTLKNSSRESDSSPSYPSFMEIISLTILDGITLSKSLTCLTFDLYQVHNISQRSLVRFEYKNPFSLGQICLNNFEYVHVLNEMCCFFVRVFSPVISSENTKGLNLNTHEHIQMMGTRNIHHWHFNLWPWPRSKVRDVKPENTFWIHMLLFMYQVFFNTVENSNTRLFLSCENSILCHIYGTSKPLND